MFITPGIPGLEGNYFKMGSEGEREANIAREPRRGKKKIKERRWYIWS